MAEIEVEGKGMDSVGPASFPVKINKRFEGDTDNEIETRPTFINHLLLARMGSDVFMDIGIVPADDLASFREKPEIRFIVLDRLVFAYRAAKP